MNLRLAASLLAAAGLVALARPAGADTHQLYPVAVTASSYYPGDPPTAATDGNTGTYWSSYGPPTQWIQLDFGESVSIRKLHLVIAQLPSSESVHQIAVGQDPAHLTTVFISDSYTNDGDSLDFDAQDAIGSDSVGNVRYLRITTTSSLSWAGWREIVAYSGIDYFSYYCDTCQQAQPVDQMAQTKAAGANVAWITPLDTTWLTTKLQEAHNQGSKAVVSLEYLMFAFTAPPTLPTGPGPWPSPCIFEPGNWSALVPLLQPYQGDIAAFYLYDEPYLPTGSGGCNLPISDMSALHELVAHAFPNIPQATIVDSVSLPGMTADNFEMFDWVGFDCYGAWSSCSANIPKLESVLAPHQRMILVPWAFTSTNSASEQDVRMTDNFSHWDAEMRRTSKYVMIAPFEWRSIYGMIGVGDLGWATPTTDVGVVMKDWLAQMTAWSMANGADARVYPQSCSASGEYTAGANYCVNAFDGAAAVDTYWNAGWYGTPSAPEWVVADFGGLSTHIDHITLKTAQSSTGPTTHNIYGYAGGSWVLLGTLSGTTSDGETLTWQSSPGGVDVTKVKVETTLDPGWVAWREIEFFRQ